MSKFRAKLPHFSQGMQSMMPPLRRGHSHHDVDEHEHGHEHGYSTNTSPSKPVQPARPPTEPCPICHVVVGTASPEDIVETWSVLPCGHRFGSYCVKVWLGMTTEPLCPICRGKMAHVCGHPTLPRPTSPPPSADDDEQDRDDEHDGRDEVMQDIEEDEEKHKDEAAGVMEVDTENELAGEGQSTATNGSNAVRTLRSRKQRMNPKRAVMSVVGRVRSRQEARLPESAVVEAGADAAAAGSRAHQHRVKRHRRGGQSSSTSSSGSSGPSSSSNSPSSSISSVGPPTLLPPPGSPAAAAVPPPPPPASASKAAAPPLPPSPSLSILSMLSSASSSLSSKAPQMLVPAYPRTVDLTTPCTYCYLRFQSQPEQSAYMADVVGGGGGVYGSAGVYGGAGAVKTASRIIMQMFTPSHARQPSRDEANIVAAYWESWRQAHGKAFGQWWAEQLPQSPPAETPPARGWNLWDLE